MEENESVKMRLVAFIKFLGIGQGKFEQKCGLANGYVNNIRKSITPDKLQIIARCYPDLNPGWLMTGEGEMLRSVSQNGEGNNNQQGNWITYNSPSTLEKLVENSIKQMELTEKEQKLTENAQRQMEKAQEHIERLLAIIEKLTLNVDSRQS